MSNTAENFDPGMTSREVMAELGCKNTKFWELIETGAFPDAFKLGRETRVPRSNVIAYRERNRVQPRKSA